MNAKRILQRRQQQSKEKRNRVMVILFFVCMALIVAGSMVYNAYKDSEVDSYGAGGWLKVQNPHAIGAGRVAEAVQGALLWNSYYDCGRSVVIRPMLGSQTEVPEAGPNMVTLEIAGPGWIEIGPSGSAYLISLHAMTHACKVVPTRRVDPGWLYSDGEIYGIDGLGLLVHPHGKSDNEFQLFEESAAEQDASCLPGANYVWSNDPRYNAITYMIKNYFGCDRVLAEMVKHSDIEGFVRQVLVLPNNAPVGGKEIEQVMRLFQQAWDQASY